ncbi:MAG: hypothetical protein NT108_03220 [Candidatus Kaiserbacteria bacterium]|nr:hypothetical protein [Candidatus Kaiserbacteria bacterium]
MTDQAFPSLSFAQLDLSGIPAGGTLLTWALYAIFIFWAVYTFVAIYHWLKYSHASWLAFPAIAAHLFISIALMSYALSGNGFFLAPYLP